MKLTFRFAWYDIWVGLYIDRKAHALYICPLPCCMVKVERVSQSVKCPSCGSDNWRCYNERTGTFEDADGDLYNDAVGELVCIDCGKAFSHTYAIDPEVEIEG